jgi:acyl-CoA reductase-like NAD-dependent aldehyde dehydrogenase
VVVITPFNFPFALAGGPVAAALVTGNTVVLKGATDTPRSGRMAAGAWPRPCIAEMGGKKPPIVSAGAELDRATLGRKGSGTSGKGIASAYYLALYQREQSQTRVE